MRFRFLAFVVIVFSPVLLVLSLIGNAHRVQAAVGTTQATTTLPPQAAAVGYTSRTFSSSFDKDVDMANSRTSGFNWYLSRWNGWPATKAEALHFNSAGDGLTLTSGGERANFAISSAAYSGKHAPDNWVGTAFGGGAYFEASLKFDPDVVRKIGDPRQCPAWWLWPLEQSMSNASSQWKGQPAGFQHHTEVDIMEYSTWQHYPSNFYSGAVHEWYGIHNKTCANNCQVTNYNNSSQFNNAIIEVPANTDFRQYHRYGLLWVPATPKSKGYVQYYFDGKPTNDKITWTMYQDQPPPPGKNSSWSFGVLDRQHMFLILGTGINQPMTVQWVNVWQKSTAQNLQK